MSKMKKRRQKKVSITAPTVSPVFNNPLPGELPLPPMGDATDLHSSIAEMNHLKADGQVRNAGTSGQESERVPSSSELKAFANIATNAWRIKIKMVDSDTGEAKEDMKRFYRHIEAIFESLGQIGVETIDPIRGVYDSGMALKVLSFEPTPGLSHEEIKETIKPSVIWQGRLIQIGEVIVGTPQLG